MAANGRTARRWTHEVGWSGSALHLPSGRTARRWTHEAGWPGSALHLPNGRTARRWTHEVGWPGSALHLPNGRTARRWTHEVGWPVNTFHIIRNTLIPFFYLQKKYFHEICKIIYMKIIKKGNMAKVFILDYFLGYSGICNQTEKN